MKVLTFLRKNLFILLLLAAFLLTDYAAAAWDPMMRSLRFQPNDFTKTITHHQWRTSGRVFFGNSSITGAYMEDKSRYPLVEMGLSYGKITDLQAILERGLYHIDGQLVLGIDVHTMLDKLPTDPTYQWFKPWYQPYLYRYRDYFKVAGDDLAVNFYKAAKSGQTDKLFAYQPKWNDKELYFGRKDDAWLKDKWNEYDKRFGWMRPDPDFKQNLDALDWVLAYVKAHNIDFKVVWMPWNTAFPKPPYAAALKDEVNRKLQAQQVPTLDLMDRYQPTEFHDLVHLNRETGAPLFTKEVDEWLLSFEKPSKS